MTDDDKSGIEVLATVIGAMALVFGVEAATWYAAHQFAWWTFALAMGGGLIGYQVAKSAVKDIRKRRRQNLASRRLAETIVMAAARGRR